ncbi:hypothetical protein WAI453_012632 [Rhynchosporium graminicola]
MEADHSVNPPFASKKIQPWKAQWLAKQSTQSTVYDDKETATRDGTSHGFSKGQEVILDGTTAERASRLLRNKD